MGMLTVHASPGCHPQLHLSTADVKGNSAGLLTPPQLTLSFAPQNNPKHSKTTCVRGPKGNAEAKNEKRKPPPLKAGGEVVTPNATKPEMVATNSNAEGPLARPTILTRQQQKEAGTPLMEGMDFNK